MIKFFGFFIPLLILFSFNLFSQAGEWVWLKGDSAGNSQGNFGVQGVPSPANYPPDLYEACQWVDLNGNFWLYGGAGGVTSYHNFCDLWRYTPSTNEWTWMKGNQTSYFMGDYGIQGIPSPTNLPPSSGYGTSTWVDQTGNLWMFGADLRGNIWKYDISTNEWTWMKGTGTTANFSFGTLGVPDTSNYPPAANECAASWTDANNNLWKFGGSWLNEYNSMWMFNISTNTWTWMKGSQISDPGYANTVGVEDSLNLPCSRSIHTHWKDKAGDFWIYGGGSFDFDLTYGDLWKFKPSTKNWIFMNGNNSSHTTHASYGTPCLLSHSNWPTMRMEARSTWVDLNGDLWMFGGTDYDCYYMKNDLWKYCIADSMWVWISGDSIPNSRGSWGVKGVSDPTNSPRARLGSISWSSDSLHLYLFGGADFVNGDYLNDLWMYTINPTCAPCTQNPSAPSAQFGISVNSFCEGACANFYNLSNNATSYNWFFPGAVPSGDTAANPQGVCYNTQGSFDVTLVATNSVGTDTFTLVNGITVFPPISFASISQRNDTLFSVPGLSTYQWYLDTMLIAGATNYFFIAMQNGDYTVQVSDSNGCIAAATMINVITSIGENKNANENFIISIEGNSINLNIPFTIISVSEVRLSDKLGQEIFHKKLNLASGNNELEINVPGLSTGIYFLNFNSEEGSFTRKIFIR